MPWDAWNSFGFTPANHKPRYPFDYYPETPPKNRHHRPAAAHFSPFARQDRQEPRYPKYSNTYDQYDNRNGRQHGTPYIPWNDLVNVAESERRGIREAMQKLERMKKNYDTKVEEAKRLRRQGKDELAKQYLVNVSQEWAQLQLKKH